MFGRPDVGSRAQEKAVPEKPMSLKVPSGPELRAILLARQQGSGKEVGVKIRGVRIKAPQGGPGLRIPTLRLQL